MAFVLPSSATVDPQKTGGFGLNIRSAPARRGRRVAAMPDNARVAVVGIARQDFNPDSKTFWYQVLYRGRTGYSLSDYLRLDPLPTVPLPLNAVVDGQKTSGQGLNLRQTPSRSGRRVATMRAGAPMQIIGAAREGLSSSARTLWYHVLFGATRGYCASNFLGVGSTPVVPVTTTPVTGPFVGVWPVVFSQHVITAPFNQPRSYGLHEGIDLRVGVNKPPVLAWADGRVTFTWVWDGVTKRGNHAYGNHVKIFHPALGLSTMYCHLDSFSVSRDRTVQMGEEIGRAGNTGNSSGAHLHLMIIDPVDGLNGYVYKKVVDPLPYLPKPYTFK